MCIELELGETIKVKESFQLKGRILVQTKPNEAKEIPRDYPIYWDGWVRSENEKHYLLGSWERIDIFATKFNQLGRWYDVPKGDVVKGIALDRGERIIIKVTTRDAVGFEKEVQKRFAQIDRRTL
jgi:hypothetical protein